MMSPSQVFDRSYAALKQRLRDGLYPPGQRLDAPRLADELDVSITPVRDVLHRLTGEDLVTAVPGDGFHVPVIIEDELRDLLQWNMELLGLALRMRAGTSGSAPDTLGLSPPERWSALFDAIAARAASGELQRAIAHNNDRLNPFRALEGELFANSDDELARLETALGQGLIREIVPALRRYHSRRQRHAAELVRARRG